MTDRIDPGPGWRLLKVGERKPNGYEWLSRRHGKWQAGGIIGELFDGYMAPCRVRIAPRTTKAIATRATVICGTPDGARTINTISRESGLTEYDGERISKAWGNMQVSTAKYIMLEIQREGEA